MKDWELIASANGIHPLTFKSRVSRGWPLEKSATKPVINKNGEEVKKWELVAKKNGIKIGTFRSRINKSKSGWDLERAATEPVKDQGRRDDRNWIAEAEKNGISSDVYRHRVDNLFWSKEEASTIPVMTRREVSELGVKARVEYREIINERIFKDQENLFKLTPQHLEIAEENGIKRETARLRVRRDGLTVQEAITKPIQGLDVIRPEGYFEHLEMAKENGVSASAFGSRVKRGWTVQEAATRGLVNPGGFKRPDKEWMELAVQNEVNIKTYIGRISRGWTPGQAATIPALKFGEYLNEDRRERATKGFEEFRGFKGR